MGRLIVLGNCSNQTAQYEATNFVIDTGDFKVLLDAGPGVVKQLYRAGLFATDIDLVVITHSHGDHTLGFPYFLFSNFAERFQGKRGSTCIPVIALREVYNGIMNMFAFSYPPGKYPNFEVENWEASSSEAKTFQLKSAKITTTPVTHTVPTIGLCFETSSTKIAFSCDTIYDQRIVELAKGSQVLVHEAFATSEMEGIAAQTKHSIAAEAGKAARDAGVQVLILSHILPGFMDKAHLLIDEASKYYSGKIIVPSELDKIEI